MFTITLVKEFASFWDFDLFCFLLLSNLTNFMLQLFYDRSKFVNYMTNIVKLFYNVCVVVETEPRLIHGLKHYLWQIFWIN